MPAKLYLCQCNNCIFVIYIIKAGCTNDSKTVFLSAHINILPNSQSLKSYCQNYSHCTFASRKNGSTTRDLAPEDTFLCSRIHKSTFTERYHVVEILWSYFCFLNNLSPVGSTNRNLHLFFFIYPWRSVYNT